MKPVADKAEVSLEFPDKTYMGSFTRHSSFQAQADAEGVAVKLVRAGGDGHRVVGIHLHWYLFADILDEVAAAIETGHPVDAGHRAPLHDAAARLARATRTGPR
ncbi:MAG: hypothetical protein R3F55_13885 [Alphaproteobacteria bacterium]